MPSAAGGEGWVVVSFLGSLRGRTWGWALCAVLGLSLMPGSGPAAASVVASASQASVVRAYVAALARHDGPAVCRLFAPQLVAYEIKSDAPAPGRRRSCAATVGAHFRDYYSRHRWAAARVRGRMVTRVERRTGIAAVRFRLVHRYVCAAQSQPPQLCRPSSYVRPEVVYVIRSGRGWKIIKPGRVYEATTTPDPVGQEGDYYPPGTAATIAGGVSSPLTSTSCPARGTTYGAPPHHLQSTFEPNPRGVPGDHPDLVIDRVAVSKTAADTACFTITLAGAPKPDDEYDISVGRVFQQGAAELFSVQFDGLGDPHPLLAQLGAASTPSLRATLPRVSLTGDQLQLVGSDPIFRSERFLVVVGTSSIQSDEPLIARPVDAGDISPFGGCLTFPSGHLDRQGNCGSTPGP
jgi:hypothetical protein